MYILSEMLNNSLGKEYDYQGHTWVNDTLSCGCLVAKCVSISPSGEDIEIVEECFNKKNILISWIKNKIGDIYENTIEIEKVDNQLKSFIKTKREILKLDRSVDFNGEYFFIKLRQGQNCDSYY